MNHEGHFPSDFQMAKTVDLVRVLDSKYFRILFIYIVLVSHTLGSLSDLHDQQRNSFFITFPNSSHPFATSNPQKSLNRISSTDSQLDRILLFYHLPTDIDALKRYAGGREMTHSATRIRNVKLQTLWEYLGALKLLDYDKMRKGMI